MQHLEHQRREAALTELEHLSRSAAACLSSAVHIDDIMSDVGLALVAINDAGEIIGCNPAFAELVGAKAPVSLQGAMLDDMFPAVRLHQDRAQCGDRPVHTGHFTATVTTLKGEHVSVRSAAFMFNPTSRNAASGVALIWRETSNERERGEPKQ